MSRYGIVPFIHPFGSRSDSFFDGPSRIFDQHFGLNLVDEELYPPTYSYYVRPRRQLTRQNSGISEIRSDPNKFQVMLDVNQFTPEEITVKTIDNTVIVHGKHEEKVDEHGYVSREFQRRYVLPENVVPETVTSSLSHDGILTIEAPRKALEAPKANERVVTIVRKDTPAVQAVESPAPENKE